MTQERLGFGKEGEEAARKFLKKRKYRILEMNFQTNAGEIDIVAEQDGILVFIEVKSRSSADFGAPIEAVNSRKQRKMIQVANRFRAKHEVWDRDCRFDVVTVEGDPNMPSTWKLELFQDAFRL